MRFLIYGLNFSPELTGVGKYTGELAEALVAKGHDVHVVTAPPYYPDWEIHDGFSNWWYSFEASDGMTVRRCPIWVPRKPGGIRRLLHLLTFAMSSLPAVLAAARLKPDLVLTVEPTLFVAPGALFAAKLSGASSWLHVQDLELDAAFELGLLGSSVVRRGAERMERSLLRRFSCVSTISRAMSSRLHNKCNIGRPIVQFPNWVDTDAIFPASSPNILRNEIGIDESRVVALYSGNMGNKQGLDILAECARLLADESGIHFIFCGTGSGKAELLRDCRGLNNVSFMDLQPVDRLNELLNAADIHLLPQRSDAEELVLPSKATGMLASGRPVVATASPDSELGKLIRDCGVVVEPGDAVEFANAVKSLATDLNLRESLGRAARNRAIESFCRRRVIDNFLEHAASLVGARNET